MKSNKTLEFKRSNLAFLAILIFLTFSVMGAIGVIGNLSRVPYWDEWDARIQLYSNLRAQGIGGLFHRHNEHYPILSYLLQVIDIRYFHGRNWFVYTSNFIAITISILLVGRIIIRNLELREMWDKVLIYAGASTLFLTLVQSENLFWANQSSFIFGIYLTIHCLYYLQNLTDINLRTFTLIATLLILNVFTLAAGIIVPYLATFAIWKKFKNKKYTAILALISLSSTALYLQGYSNTTQNSEIQFSLTNLLSMVIYCVKYLVAPFFIATKSNLGLAILCSLLFTFLLFFNGFRIQVRLFNKSSFSFLIILFTFCTITMTAVGRIKFGTDQAFASRYTIVIYLLVAGLLILESEQKWKTAKRRITRIKYLLLLLVFIQLPYQSAEMTPNKTLLTSRLFAQQVVKLQIPISEVTSGIYPDTNRLLEIAKPYVSSGLFNFDNEGFISREQLGTPVRITENRIKCSMHFDSVTMSSVPDYILISGWLLKGSSDKSKIVVVDSENRLRGVIFAGIKRSDVAEVYGKKFSNAGILGILNSESNPETIMNLFKDGQLRVESSKCTGQII